MQVRNYSYPQSKIQFEKKNSFVSTTHTRIYTHVYHAINYVPTSIPTFHDIDIKLSTSIPSFMINRMPSGIYHVLSRSATLFLNGKY